jgi:aryl-alcohol dehydrogenase-like predicted oxidoreductase
MRTVTEPPSSALERRLGAAELSLTCIGIGAWAMGGGCWTHSWGPQDDGDSIAAIRAALDAGINWIDTAPVYGLGHAEKVIARALEGCPDRPYVFTKAGMVWDERGEIRQEIRRASIRREAEDSLRRLRVETLDLYQLHWPSPDADLEEAWTALAELQAEGKARHIGLCNAGVSQLRRALRIAPAQSLQNSYSLLSPEAEDGSFPLAAARGIGVLAYSPMKSGLLSGSMTRERVAALPADDYRRRRPEFQEPQLSRHLQLVDLLAEIGRPHGRSAGEVAIAWTLRNPAVTGAIVGVRSSRQVEGILGAAAFRLAPEELRRIDAFLGRSGPGAVVRSLKRWLVRMG